MKKGVLSRILLIVGALLIVFAVGLLAYTRVLADLSERKNDKIVAEICKSMPDIVEGTDEQRSNTDMPILQIDGDDFIGILSCERYDVELPVYNLWVRGKLSCFPCRYIGSAYDGTLIIGGADDRRQLSFIKQIGIGETVCITDTEGTKFSYTVDTVEHSKNADTETLVSSEHELVLFVRNTYSPNYVIARCSLEQYRQMRRSAENKS